MSRLEQEVLIRDAREDEREQIAKVMLEAYRQYAFDMPRGRNIARTSEALSTATALMPALSPSLTETSWAACSCS